MSGKTINVRLGDSQDAWDSLEESTDNRSETLRNLIALADSDRLQAIQDDLDASSPEEALEVLVDGYVLPDEKGNPFANYDPENSDCRFTTDELRELKEIDEEVAINPGHIERMPRAVEDKVEVLIAFIRFFYKIKGTPTVEKDKIEDVVVDKLGDSSHIMETVDYPGRIMDRFPANFMLEDTYFAFSESFAKVAGSKADNIEDDIDELMADLREDKEKYPDSSIRSKSMQKRVNEIVDVCEGLIDASEEYPEYVDVDADLLANKVDALVEYYNSEGEVDEFDQIGVEDEVEDDSVDAEMEMLESAEPVR